MNGEEVPNLSADSILQQKANQALKDKELSTVSFTLQSRTQEVLARASDA